MPGETPMDSGAPVPYRVPFEKTNWDEEPIVILEDEVI